MACGCAGSGAPKRAQPPARDRRAKTPLPSRPGEIQGAVGSKNYYYTGPERAPKPEE